MLQEHGQSYPGIFKDGRLPPNVILGRSKEMSKAPGQPRQQSARLYRMARRLTIELRWECLRCAPMSTEAPCTQAAPRGKFATRNSCFDTET